MPRQEVIVRSLSVFFFSLLLPHFSAAQTIQPRNSAEAAGQRAAAEQKLEKAKKETKAKEKELGEQKTAAEDAEKAVSENVNVDDEIKKLEEEIRKLALLKNKVLNDAPLNADEKEAYKGVMGGDTAPVAPEIRSQIIEDAIKAKQEKLKKLKELQADPDRDEKRKAAEEKLKKAKARILELETELENDRAEITRLESDLEEKRKTEQRLREEEKARAARRKKAAAEAEAKAAKEALAAAVEEQKNAVNKVDEEKNEIESRKQLAKLMAKGFRLISDAVKKLAKLAAGDLGEAIAELATLQLKIGADILDELDGLISNIDGIKRLPNGHYVATTAGDIQLNEFIEALNKLVAANKKLKAAIDRAKRAQQALLNAQGGLETIHRQQKQMNESFESSKANEASFSFLPNSHQTLTTSEGQQRLAIVNQFAMSDDLAGLREFVKDQASSISDGDANSETQIVHTLALDVISSADQTIDLLTRTHEASQGATTPVEAANGVFRASLASQRSMDSSLSPDYRVEVTRLFQGSILQEFEERIALADRQPSLPGAHVIKGSASLPKNGGTPPDVIVTATVSLFGDDGEKLGDETQLTNPDKDGNYEIRLPENGRLNDVKIASRDLVETLPRPRFRNATGDLPWERDNNSFYVGVSGLQILDDSVARQPSASKLPVENVQLAKQLDMFIFGRPDKYKSLAEDPFLALVPRLVRELIQKSDANNISDSPAPNGQPVIEDWDDDDLGLRPRGIGIVVEYPADAILKEHDKFIEGLSRSISGEKTDVKITGVEIVKLPSPESALNVPIPGDLFRDGEESQTRPSSNTTDETPKQQALIITKYVPRTHRTGLELSEGDLSLIELIVKTVDDKPSQEFGPSQSPQISGSDAMIRLNQRLAELTATQIVVEVRMISLEADFIRDGEATVPSDPHYTSTGTWKQDYADQWALHRVGGDPESKVWSEETSDAETCVVAVVGSGIDWTHPELMGQMWRNMDEVPGNNIDDDENGYIDDVWGWNFRGDNARVMDQGGHDTHIAGVIAARWDDRGIAGVNPHARIMALKVANQLAQSDSISIARAIIYAADNGARVINVSYGGPTPSRVEQAAIHYATDKGALVVVAAGNKAKDASKYALAGSSGVLTVAGTTLDDERAPFSNFGFPIDIAAPGMDVLGLRARGTDFLLYVAENDEYVGGTGIVGNDQSLYRASGTSFAAPLVSGAASLLFSQNPSLTNHDVAAMLLSSVTDLETPGTDQYTGFGLLNMQQARHADPSDFLAVSISKVSPARVDGKIVIQVNGSVSGARLEERQIQVAFGENPEEKDWVMVSRSYDREQGTLGQIPVRFFTKKGIWTIRVSAKSLSGSSNEARATININ